jgi:hypothetical protein
VRDPQHDLGALEVLALEDEVFERGQRLEVRRLDAVAASGLIADRLSKAAYELRVHRGPF